MELGTLIILGIIIYSYWGSKGKRKRTLRSLKNSIDAAYANTSLEGQKEYLDVQARKLQESRDEEQRKKENTEKIIREIEEKNKNKNTPPF